MDLGLSRIANYIALNVAGVSFTYLTMKKLFPRRRSPVLLWSYFLIKALIDAFIRNALVYGSAGAQVELFQSIWVFVTGLASFVVFYETFEGDLMTISFCAVLCDLYAGIWTTVCTSLGNLVFGLPGTLSFLAPFGMHTVFQVTLCIVACFCTRSYMAWLLRWFCRITKRNRIAWGIAAFCMAFLLVGMTQQLANFVVLSNHMAVIAPLTVLTVVVAGTTMLLRMRDERRRRNAFDQCSALAQSYDSMVREQLQAMEDDLSALEGHDKVLRAINLNEDESLNEVHQLEHAYHRLCSGAYCDRPALDVVLQVAVRRLRELGAHVSVSVAGVSTHVATPSAIILTLVNLACEAADRAKEVRGSPVELRVRDVGEQVMIRLEVPERWGMLWARRYLLPLCAQSGGLVREQRVGDRRVVLVVQREGDVG